MTVRGPVPADELGVTLMHEHVFADTMREYRGDGFLHDLDVAVAELQAYRRAGGGTIVDVTGSTLGRDPLALREVSERADVHIVMGCGFYRDPYAQDGAVDRHSVAELADQIIDDLTIGVDGVRAGIIGEVGADAAWVSAIEERALRAAGRAQLRTGSAIMLHAARWPVGRELVAILDEVGVGHDRIIVGHLDTVPDPEFHRAMVEVGCWVEFDGFCTPVAAEAARHAAWVAQLVDSGHIDRVLVSHDVFLQSHLAHFGGGGYTPLLRDASALLRSAGLRAAQVEQLLVQNPARVLVGT